MHPIILAFLVSYRSSDGEILIASSSDGYCSIIHFEKGELGKIYKMKDSVQESNNAIVKETKSSGKKSSNNTLKDKNNVPTFDVDDCAMDVELVKSDATDAITNNQSEELDKQKPDEVMSQDIRSENDLQINKKLNEEETEDIKLVYNEESNERDIIKTKTRNTPPKSDVAPIICHKTPRRVKLITLSSPKELKKQ